MNTKKGLGLGSLAGLSVLTVLTVLVVAAVPENEVYLVPRDSTAPFNDTIAVQIWANTTGSFAVGQINLTYTPGCIKVTQVEYGPQWQGTWDSSSDGREWLVFIRPLGQPTVSGTSLIGNLTIECCTARDCVTTVTFAPPSKLNDPLTGDLTVTWSGGTVTCPTPPATATPEPPSGGAGGGGGDGSSTVTPTPTRFPSPTSSMTPAATTATTPTPSASAPPASSSPTAHPEGTPATPATAAPTAATIAATPTPKATGFELLLLAVATAGALVMLRRFQG